MGDAKSEVPADVPGRRALVDELRTRMLAQKTSLNQQVLSGEITEAEFAKQVNALLASTLREAAPLLTDSEFVDAFGLDKSTIPVLLYEERGPSE